MGRTKKCGEIIEVSSKQPTLRLLVTVYADGRMSHRKVAPDETIYPLAARQKAKPPSLVSPQATKLASSFLRRQQKDLPKLVRGVTRKKIERAAGVIEKLHRLDGFEWRYIRAVLAFALEDEFWKPNLISPTSLRAVSKTTGEMKFVNIANAMEREKMRGSRNRGGALLNSNGKKLKDKVIGSAAKLNHLAVDILSAWNNLPGDPRAYSPRKAKCKTVLKTPNDLLARFATFVGEMPNAPGISSCTPPEGATWLRFLQQLRIETGYDPATGRRAD